MAFLDL